MSEEKQTADSPTVIIKTTELENPPKTRNTKKIALFVVGGVVLVAIILIAILVGMYMFTKAQLDILQYSQQLDKNTKQDVTSDPNTNIVQFHVSNADYEAWTYNDFNRDIQVVKLKTASSTICYSSPLNRTTAQDPSSMTVPKDKDISKFKNSTLTYRASNTPIPDTSFLSKTVRDACNGISTYWTYPECNTGDATYQRKKRDTNCYRCTLIGCDDDYCYYHCVYQHSGPC